MAWTPVALTKGDEVVTPHGNGKVVNVSINSGEVRVDVGGQLFDVPAENVTHSPDGQPDNGADAPAPSNKEGEAVNFEAGDRVKLKGGSKEGTVNSVTQRSVYVKWDGDKGRSRYDKNGDAERELEKMEQPTKEEQPAENNDNPVTPQATADSLYGLLQLQKHLENRIDAEVDGELAELRDQVKKSQSLEVKVGENVNKVEGIRHPQLETLITYAGLRLASLLVGMAGTGKTHAAEQVAEALGLNFYSMSVGAQTSKSDIIGYMDASGNYVQTFFRKAYEEGGVFLMDEIDAGNANVLIQVNAALSNGLCAFPDKMVKQHEDFVFIASANTYGNGANRQYVGRNQLDAATLDRFAVIDWKIDTEMEQQLAIGKYGKAWHLAVKAARDFVSDKNIRALVSPRATIKGSQLLAAGIAVEEVITSVLLSSVPEDKKNDVTQVAKTVFNNHASDVPSQISDDVRTEAKKFTPEEILF